MIKRNINLLYVGGVHPEGSSYSRYKAFLQNCTNVSLLDTSASHTILGRIMTKFIRRLGVNLDAKFLTAATNNSLDIIWVDKPTMISVAALKKISIVRPKILKIAHITDDISKIIIYLPSIVEVLMQFDCVFTCNKLNIEEYKEINFVYCELGYDEDLYSPLESIVKTRSNDLSFVGHYEASYEDQIIKISHAIKGSEFKIKIYGTGWWRSKRVNSLSNVSVQSGWLSIENVKNIYQNSLLGIGLYSDTNRNMTSGRIFEIPALFTPLMTKGNSIIESFIGVNYISMDLVCDTKEFLSVIRNRKYLDQLATQANKCLRVAKCSWQDRVIECLDYIEKSGHERIIGLDEINGR